MWMVFAGRVKPVISKLAPGVAGSVLGLVGPVCCEGVR